MTDYLIDTNVISELARPRPAPGVTGFIAGQKLSSLHLAEVTLAEIRFGIERLADPIKRRRLEGWLEDSVRPLFAGRVLASDEAAWLTWRLLLEQARRSGYTPPQPDLMLAAIAFNHGLTVVTRDTAPFEAAGVAVVNPFA